MAEAEGDDDADIAFTADDAARAQPVVVRRRGAEDEGRVRFVGLTRFSTGLNPAVSHPALANRSAPAWFAHDGWRRGLSCRLPTP